MILNDLNKASRKYGKYVYLLRSYLANFILLLMNTKENQQT